jgi:hypothetical protein
MELALSILIGIGLAAACGFRVFVPFLVISIASLSGHLDLAPGFEWIGTYYALTAFAIATVLEILAYYIPWFDNLMDAIATPAAVVAGAIIMAAVVGDMSPFLRWSLAIIAGIGVAGAVQGTTVALRGASTATTGGLANPVVSTGELAGSVVTSVLAVILPILAVALLAIMSFGGARRLRAARARARSARCQ